MLLQEKYISPALKASQKGLDRAMRHAFSVTAIMIAAWICAYLVVISAVLPGLTSAKFLGGAAALGLAFIGYWARSAKSLRLPVAAFVFLSTLLTLGVMATNGGVTSYVTPLLIVSCLTSGFFLDIRASLVTAALISISVISFYILQDYGLVQPSAYDPEHLEIAAVIVLCVACFLCAICVGTLTSHLDVFSMRLASSRAQLESLVENAPVSLAMFDKRMHYVRCSQDWLEEHDLVGKDVVDASHYELVPGSEKHWRETHLRCLGGATERSDGEHFETPDGKGKIVAWEITPWRDHSGQIAGVLMITRDITEQKRLKDNLVLAADVAETALAQKAELLENISYEIREPLMAMIGVTQLLQRTHLEAAQARMVESVIESGKSLSDIIGRLLESAELDSKSEIGAMETFDVQAVLTNLVKTLSDYADARDVSLNTQNRVAGKQYVGNRECLERALSYASVDAIRRAGDGDVSITVWEAGEGRLKFEVSGPQEITSTSDALTRAAREQALAFILAERMGGKLEVSTNADGEFALTLDMPVQAEAAVMAEVTDHTRLQPAGKHSALSILVVDDNATNREVLQRALSGAGHRVEVNFDGQGALERLTEDTFDLVFMDLHMPKMTGKDAIMKIRSGEAGDPGIPIIIITADARIGSRESSLAAGANDWIAKPIDFNELFEKISSATSGKEGKLPIAS